MDAKKYIHQFELFGARMRSIRKAKKMTLLDLEVITGINNGDLSRIENGKTNIEFITIAKLAEALEVEIVQLFNYKGAIAEPKLSISKPATFTKKRGIKKQKSISGKRRSK